MSESERRKLWNKFWRDETREATLLWELSRIHGDINYFLFLIYCWVKEDIWSNNNFSTVVELGTRSGESTGAIGKAVAEGNDVLNRNIRLYSIDIDPVHDRALELINKSGCKKYWEYIQGDDMEVVKNWDKPINFLFIDTSHEYEHTKNELKYWVTKVVSGGSILFHDTRSRYKGVSVPIQEFMNDNGHKYDYYEIPLITGLGMMRVK